MKTMLTIFMIITAVLASGCVESSPAAALPATPAQTTVPVIPSLIGSWAGPMEGYDEGTGFTDYTTLTTVMMVTEQHGRLFAGNIVFKNNGSESKTGFAGAIGRDGKTLSITEKGGGYCTGEILAADEIELIYVEDGSPYSVAIDTFRRG